MEIEKRFNVSWSLSEIDGKLGGRERNWPNQEAANDFEEMDSDPGSREDRMVRAALDGSGGGGNGFF